MPSLNPNQALLAEHMSEKELTDSIIEMAQTLGWLVDGSYFRDRLVGIAAKEKRFDAFPDAGFPDLVLAQGNSSKEWNISVIFAEIKTEKGKLSDEQEIWRDVLTSVMETSAYMNRPLYPPQVFYYIWRPSNWHSGEIEQVLRGQR